MSEVRMTARPFISSHRNCRRFLAATHHVAILNNYSHDLQLLHFTVERGSQKFVANRYNASPVSPAILVKKT